VSGLSLDHDRARRAAHTILQTPGTDGIEVVVSASEIGLTRYANSEIIQNTVRNEVRAYVRAVVGSRVATATTNQLDEKSMQSAAQRAVEAARASVEDPLFPGLADPQDVGRAEPVNRWDERTATTSPSARAEKVNEILALTKGLNAAGIYETGGHAYGVFSSTGVDCFDAYSRCNVICLTDSGEATGWGEASSHTSAAVDVEKVATTSRGKADAGPGKDAEPGTYEVILEASAVATLIEYLGYSGFGAKQVIEGESFLAARQGQQVADPSVTIADDAFHELSVGIGFDFEGVPKQRVAVIDSGVATGPVTDLRTARQLGTKSTGHASGSTEFGPYAFQLVFEPGDADTESMISAVKDGFLVTRFHYVNILDRPSTLLTGMTRDGTFRIRDGEIAEPVHNFRFSQNVLEALTSVKAVGSDARSIAPEYGSFGSTVAPPLRVGAFHFASRTSH
jgi:PmbA protein